MSAIQFLDFDRIVRIPFGLELKSHLLHEIAARLEFPDYFGGNWDALADCLCDLSWLGDQRILLLHEDLPLGNDKKEAQSYLDVLLDAQESWQQDGTQRLAIVFPKHLRKRIQKLDRRA